MSQLALPEIEVSRRLAKIYDMALAAAERESFVIELTDDEARQARTVLMDFCGAELREDADGDTI